MESIKATARLAGLLYFLMSIMMVISFMYVPSLFSGDAATTARKIAENELLYRGSVLMSFAAQILFVFVVLNLYRLFRAVDGHLARLMVCLVCVGVTAEVVGIAYRMAPLLLAHNTDFQAAFAPAQLATLGDGFLVLSNNLGRFLTAFWGIWLIPFGLLTIKSGFFPRILGFFLLAAGLGYITSCITYILFPDAAPTVSKIVFPLYYGELPIILWMLVMGAKEPRMQARPALAT